MARFEVAERRGGELRRGAKLVVPAGGAAVLATVLAVGWFAQPDRYARGYAPAQPVAYSHRLHAGVLKIPCLYCHAGAERSRYAGVPPAETCAACHRVTKADSPEVRKVLRALETGEPILWKRVHALPDHVAFDHRPHVAAGMLCQTCHGEVQEMDVLSQRMSLRMGNCLGCHREARAALPAGSPIARGPEHCNACHR